MNLLIILFHGIFDIGYLFELFQNNTIIYSSNIKNFKDILCWLFIIRLFLYYYYNNTIIYWILYVIIDVYFLLNIDIKFSHWMIKYKMWYILGKISFTLMNTYIVNIHIVHIII